MECALSDEEHSGSISSLNVAPWFSQCPREALYTAADCFMQYRRIAYHCITHHRREAFLVLPTAHQEVLKTHANLLHKFDRVEDAIDANITLVQAMYNYLETSALDGESPIDLEWSQEWDEKTTLQAGSQVSTILRHLYRDWSVEGAFERHLWIDPVLDELKRCFGPKADGLKVLQPGSGLGRLAYEMSLRGYDVDANEMVIHKLIATHFIYDFPFSRAADLPEKYELYPFVNLFANQVSIEHQLRKVMIPDVQPVETLRDYTPDPDSDETVFYPVTLVCGDFTHIYRQQEYKDAFDIVVTVFFIDSAPNLLNYIGTIRHCLRNGGVWINIGPLFWDTDLEFTHEEVISLVKAAGFVIEKQEIRERPVGYCQNPDSMLQNLYRVALWVAKKEVHEV